MPKLVIKLKDSSTPLKLDCKTEDDGHLAIALITKYHHCQIGDRDYSIDEIESLDVVVD